MLLAQHVLPDGTCPRILPCIRYWHEGHCYAESLICMLQGDTRTLLMCSGLGAEFWNFAWVHACWLRARLQRTHYDENPLRETLPSGEKLTGIPHIDSGGAERTLVVDRIKVPKFGSSVALLLAPEQRENAAAKVSMGTTVTGVFVGVRGIEFVVLDRAGDVSYGRTIKVLGNAGPASIETLLKQPWRLHVCRRLECRCLQVSAQQHRRASKSVSTCCGPPRRCT